MKKLLLLSFCLFGTFAFSQQGNYIIEINGEKHTADLDKPFTLNINGKDTQVKLSQPEFLNYNNSRIGFEYPKSYNFSAAHVEDGIIQITCMNASGDGLMLQQYDGISPKGLETFMLAEITKESLNYGYKMTRDVYTSKLASGQSIDCIHAQLTYLDDISDYTACSYGGRDEGLIIVTMQSNYGLTEVNELFQTFWNSIVYKDVPPPPIKSQ